MKKLRAKSKVEVIRRGLKLLKETTDRKSLKVSYLRAAAAVRQVTETELEELDHLASESLE